ncbi:MAG: phosphopantetheine-binding protein [Sphingomonadaceae bacterium]
MPDGIVRKDRDALGAIRAFILDRFLFSDDQSLLADDQSLTEAGILDSMGALELIEFLEATFDVTIDNADIGPRTLDSVNAILALVHARRRAAAER